VTQEEAFLAQARSDYLVFERLQEAARSDVSECHVLHYYQMATEKLAKALLARVGHPVGKTHFAFGRIAAILAGRQDILTAIGCPNPPVTARFLARADALFRQIENLSPDTAGKAAKEKGLAADQGPNVEYPWWQEHPATGPEWLAPAAHTFPAYQTVTAASGDGLTLRVFVERLLQGYDRIP